MNLRILRTFLEHIKKIKYQKLSCSMNVLIFNFDKSLIFTMIQIGKSWVPYGIVKYKNPKKKTYPTLENGVK